MLFAVDGTSNPAKKTLLLGASGLFGSAFARRLNREGISFLAPGRRELDLANPALVEQYFSVHRPNRIVFCAGRVGGILANQNYPADFMATNLALALNCIRAAHHHGVEEFVYFGSSCMYPKNAPQPLREQSLLDGIPEITSLPYGLAKIAGLYLALSYNNQFDYDRFLCLIPNNVFGPGDNFDSEHSHVIPALIRKFHEAKVKREPFVTLWGTGVALREFVFVDDLVDATLFLLSRQTSRRSPINIGTGKTVSISELADLIAKVVGYGGQIRWDGEPLDGAPAKSLEVSRIKSLGWKPLVPLEQGLRVTYDWWQTGGKE